MLDLLIGISGGCLVIIAPKQELQQLRTKSTDDGYMSERLKGVSCHDKLFAEALCDFAQHSDSDRWPETYHDAAARGLPKDGAMLLDPFGYRTKCAAKILGLVAPCDWPGHGTRHEAALAVAFKLRHAIVMIRSDGGTLHLVMANSRGRAALQWDGTCVLAKVRAPQRTASQPCGSDGGQEFSI